MKKYFLFVVGQMNDLPCVTYIVDSVAELSTSKFVKFNFVDKSTLVIHFATNINFHRLKYITDNISLNKTFNTFLVEYTDNMSVSFIDPSVMESFLDLNSDNTSKDIDKFIQQETQRYQNYDDKVETEVIVETEIEVEEDFTIDSILDKINEKGMNSLTQKELNFLKKIK